MKIELIHDVLAKKIYDRASAEDRMRTKIRDFIANRYDYYKDAKVLLDQEALDYITPHLPTITLKREVHEFIGASRQLAKRKQYTVAGGVVLFILALIVSAINLQMSNFDILAEIDDVNNRIKQLTDRNTANKALVKQVDQILTQDSITIGSIPVDKAMLQELIIQYDNLGKKQDSIQQQINLAQSATLSDLAKETKKSNEDYAFSLAIKSWELNKSNQQALQVIEQYTKSEIPLSELSEQHVESIIEQKKSKKTIKNLDNKDIKTIFSKDNIILSKQKKGIPKQLDIQQQQIRYDEKEEIEKPILLQTIQQQTTEPIEKKMDVALEPILIQQRSYKPLPPNAVVPNTINCDLVSKELDQWIKIDEARFYQLSIKYSNKQIYFKIERLGKFIPPLFSEVVFYGQDGQEQSFFLIEEKENEESIYKVKISPKSYTSFKELVLEGLSFASKNKTIPHKLILLPGNQIKLTQLNKCVL